jgi:hypothetical protein
MIKKIFLLILIASCTSTITPSSETNIEKMFKLYNQISEIIKSFTTKKTSYATTLTTNNKKQAEVLKSSSLPEFQNNQNSEEEAEVIKEPKWGVVLIVGYTFLPWIFALINRKNIGDV